MNPSWAPLVFVFSAGVLGCGHPVPRWIAPARDAAAEMQSAPRWIWAKPASATHAPVGSVWLMQGFELPPGSRVKTARLSMAADNHAVAYLNDVEVLRSDDWSQPASCEVTLKDGPNRLTIRGENDAGTDINPAGVIALLDATLGEGRHFRVITDDRWVGGAGEWPGWPTAPPPFHARPVDVIGPAETPPWKLAAAWLAPQPPCPILRSRFSIDGEPVHATVRVIGLGHYVLRLNGQTVGDTVINQAWSQYDKTLFWQEFDITALVRSGENVWAALLGNSFWQVATPNDPRRFAKTDAMPDFSNGEPYLLWLEARIRLADGRETVVGSDGAWKWTDGPLTFSHIYAGEDFDAGKEPAGWDQADFDDSAWLPVRIAAAPSAALAVLPGPGIRRFEVFEPYEVRAPAPELFTYVFPQNCSALLRFTVEGPVGRTIRFKPCEYMAPDGRVRFTYTWGTGKDIWHDYTLRGGAPETHEVLFCYVGCQYVEVSGAVPAGHANPGGLPVVQKLELVHTRAANRAVGKFMCSSQLQYSAHKLVDWAIRSNMSHVATDCPHREKNGWQEENWHMARALSYRYDDRDWLRKIAHDLRDTQLPDGHIPTNCPNYLVGVPPHGFWNEAPEWGVAGVLVPWHLYEWYGDRDGLAASFESMKRYVDYLATQAQDGIIKSNLGDWYDYGHGQGDGPSRWTPNELSATAIWALAAKTVAQAADVLERPDDAARYRAAFERIRGDFQRHFYDADTKTVRNNGSCQAAHATALCVGLVPEADRPAVVQAIVDDLAQRGWQQTTGEVLHIFLIRALAEAGRGEVLHRIYSREEPGSYGYMIKSGLTTLPESWDAKPGTGNSMNHFMLGQLVEWHFAYVAGIRQPPGSIAWRRVLIAPQPGPLEHAEATFDSPAGRIVSRWVQSAGQFELTVEIPTDIEATAVLPDGARHRLPAGTSVLRCALPREET